MQKGDTIGTFSEELPNYPVKGFLLFESHWGGLENPHITYMIIDNKKKIHHIHTGLDYLNTNIHNIRMVLIEKK